MPYAEEVWTGLEYMLASHLIARGLVDEGLTIVRAARARHDGSRRNPWNEIECGSYYARSLSSYALVNAYHRADASTSGVGEIGFQPGARRRRRLFLVGGARLGRGRISRADRDADGQGRRTRGLATAACRPCRAAPRSTAGQPSATATSILLGAERTLQAGRSHRRGSGRSVARLELKGVRKSFQSVEVIHGVDLTVEDGLVHGFRRPVGLREVDAAADDRRASRT